MLLSCTVSEIDQLAFYSTRDCSVGIDLKELGWKCLKFCPGIEVYGRFSLKNECL